MKHLPTLNERIRYDRRGPNVPKFNYFNTAEIVKAQNKFDKWLTRKTLKKHKLEYNDVFKFWHTPNSINLKRLNNDINSFVREYINPNTFAYIHPNLYPGTTYKRNELKEHLRKVTETKVKRYRNMLEREQKMKQNNENKRAAAQKAAIAAQTLENKKKKNAQVNAYAKYRRNRGVIGLGLNQIRQLKTEFNKYYYGKK